MPGGGCYLLTPSLASQGASVHLLARADQAKAEKGLSAGPCSAQGYCSDEETETLREPLTYAVTFWQVAEYNIHILTCYSAGCHLASGSSGA